MTRYRLGDQEWSVEQVGDRVITGEPDGTQREEVAGSLASTRMRVLINQKQRAGWKLIVDAPEPVAEPLQLTVENARNPELEAALLDDPTNEPAWLVYGDWLQQQGDPRGTYIAALRAAARPAPHDLLATTRLRAFEARYGDLELPSELLDDERALVADLEVRIGLRSHYVPIAE